MTGMGTPKPGPSFPHDEIPWPTEPRFIEKRHGWFGWRVYEHGDDGFTRWTYTGKFWRWINAARVAQALTLAFNAGYRSNGMEKPDLVAFGPDDWPAQACQPEAELVAWRAYCPKTGGEIVMSNSLKAMLIAQADSIYADHGYLIEPLYTSPRLDRERLAALLDTQPNIGAETNEPSLRKMVRSYYNMAGVDPDWAARRAEEYCDAIMRETR